MFSHTLLIFAYFAHLVNHWHHRHSPPITKQPKVICKPKKQNSFIKGYPKITQLNKEIIKGKKRKKNEEDNKHKLMVCLLDVLNSLCLCLFYKIARKRSSIHDILDVLSLQIFLEGHCEFLKC